MGGWSLTTHDVGVSASTTLGEFRPGHKNHRRFAQGWARWGRCGKVAITGKTAYPVFERFSIKKSDRRKSGARAHENGGFFNWRSSDLRHRSKLLWRKTLLNRRILCECVQRTGELDASACGARGVRQYTLLYPLWLYNMDSKSTKKLKVARNWLYIYHFLYIKYNSSGVRIPHGVPVETPLTMQVSGVLLFLQYTL